MHGHLPIWTVGFGVPDPAARSDLGTDTAGRLLDVVADAADGSDVEVLVDRQAPDLV